MHSWTIHEKIFMNIHVHEDSWVLRYPVFATPKSVNGHETWLGSWTSSAVTSAGLPRIIHLILGMYAPLVHKVNCIHLLGEPAWLASSAESSAHLPRIFRGAGQTTTSLLGRMIFVCPLPWTSPWIIHEFLPLNSSSVFRPSSAVLPRCWQIDMFPSGAQIIKVSISDSPYQG